jgi:hypothetical protein
VVTFVNAFNPNNIRVVLSHNITGLSIYNEIITSLEVVRDAFVIVFISDTANGFGENIPLASCEYKVHCKLIISGNAVLTQICISHIPGGIIVEDNKLSTIPN